MLVKNLRCILFDLDNTLTDRDRSARRCLREVLEQNGLIETVPDPDAFFDAYDCNFARSRDDFFSIMADMYHIDISVQKLVHDWFDLSSYDTQEFPGTTEILEQLRTRYRIGLLTNGYSSKQRRKLELTNLSRCFDAICISEEIGFEKPDPRAFQYILDRLDAKPEECVYIGDTFSNDVQGAINAGIQPIWKILPSHGDIWKQEKYSQIVKIHSLQELPEILGI